ncbi:MAG: hypothetical protein J0H60_04510 [Rhizobiales bacterium]|nr:hypothetical protein [Hyphomicrobiales bacterium]
MRVGPSTGEYATAALIEDDDPCGLWPECGCDRDCEKAARFEASPKLHFIEKLLLGLLIATAIVGCWIALT